MEQIKEFGGKTLAWIIRANESPEGVNFVPEEKLSLQLGVSTYKKGTTVTPHVHLPRDATFKYVEEVVHIDKGKVSAVIYDTRDRHVRTVELSEGDTAFFISGGHAFHFERDTRIIEVKRGPYTGRKDDKRSIIP